ncbi:LLM class flavin-dependent oxidoreductase [Halolamina sp.]|jgi:alkanesulfonate monooxygenase SsuD/methylene tetrahydromethanopterin reductase-like flavin-dependent oxidoreductase (luciferase family)|uniref:LLM class flavin-dependent oxidoreductase n=1 Tax=Halolamina sp. TaxID=1940283 RepID=UPI003567EA98
MEFAVNIPTSVGSGEATTLAFCDKIDWPIQREFGRNLESLGFDGLAVPDHAMTGDGATMECTTVLAGLAEATDDVYLYPKTINNRFRHPPFLAKTMATIDRISEGRLKLGMGGGWKDDEANAYGYDWPGAPGRLREMEETIRLMKKLWSEDEVTYDGEYVSVDGAVCKPHPVQDPHPPIMVGGPGEEFTLRIAAQVADVWNCWGSHSFYEHKLSVLADHCETYDREYDDIQKSWFGRCVIRESEAEVEELLEIAPRFRPENLDDDITHLVGTPEQIREQIQGFADLGVEEIVVEFIDFSETTGAELFADEVLPAFA